MSWADDIPPVVRVPLAGMFAWLLPGAGHLFIGERTRGIIFLVTIATTFWTGVAIGGVRDTVDPNARTAWFVAETCAGAHAFAAYAFGKSYRDTNVKAARTSWSPAHAHWVSADTGAVYAGVAGLLNLLIILDALVRADPVGAPIKEAIKRGGP